MYTKPSITHRSHFHRFLAVILSFLLLFSVGPRTAAMAGSQIDIPGPEDSGAFGQVTWLPNGNLVVVDSSYSSGIGAVYLYDGSTGAMISSLTGSVSGDQAGSGGIWV